MIATSAADVSLAEMRRLRLAIQASGEIIFTTDAEGIFTFVNPEFERIYGYTKEEVVGLATPRILRGQGTPAEVYKSFWARLKRNHVVRREFVNRTKSGVLLHIEASANPITDDCGNVVGFLAVQRDISRRKQLEAAARDSEYRYRTLAEAAQDAIFIVNRAREIEYANEASGSPFGLSAADLIGRRLVDVFPAETATEMLSGLSAVFDTGKRRLLLHQFDTPAGDLWIEAWLVPMCRDGERPHAVMGIGRNITERKVLERAFLQAQKMEALGRLAGGIAHDFNNLLTAILGYADLVKEKLHEMPEVLADVGQIKLAGERASRLTRQLLAFSRKQPVNRSVTDMNVVVADVHKMLGRVLGEDIELSLDPCLDVGRIVADPGQLEQVLLNLAVNARDAMPKGGCLKIATRNVDLDEAFADQNPGTEPGAYVSLTVQDGGCGMTQDVMAHVFEPFFTTKPTGQGTGLGLATVYGIVNQNGGFVTIDSTPDVGTTVRVFWPRTVDDGHIREAIADAGPRSLDGTESILIVEDDLGIRGLMRRALERHGYKVLEAEDVYQAQALAAAHAGPIDLLLSDVIMPGLNGPDLAQRIVACRPNAKILYVSGFPNSLVPEHDKSRTRMAFLSKPFTPQTLVEKVRACFDC